MTYQTRELTTEEEEALAKDLTAVLEKHGAEMGVVSSIQLLKRIEDPVPSQFVQPNGESNDKTEETDSKTESSS